MDKAKYHVTKAFKNLMGQIISGEILTINFSNFQISYVLIFSVCRIFFSDKNLNWSQNMIRITKKENCITCTDRNHVCGYKHEQSNSTSVKHCRKEKKKKSEIQKYKITFWFVKMITSLIVVYAHWTGRLC